MSAQHKSKHSKSRHHSSKPSHTYHEQNVEQALPPTTFLFTTFELFVADDSSGENPLNVDAHGEWTPPAQSTAYYQPAPDGDSHVYRWSNGSVSTTNCVWYDEQWWNPHQSVSLPVYRACSMFWCSPFNQFFVTNGAPSSLDMEDPDHQWRPLNFNHDYSISRVIDVGERRLAGNSEARWLRQLGLESYNDAESPRTTGLGGFLSSLIALLAFSCKSNRLHDVLIGQGAWRRQIWRGHNRNHGRIARRGILAVVYFDQENPEGSNAETLSSLEWEQGPLIQ